MTDRRSIADFRTRVADLYADVRRSGTSEASWRTWRRDRDALLLTHPDSPITGAGEGWPGQAFWDYDPTWRVLGEIDPDATGPGIEIHQQTGLIDRFDHVGVVRFTRDGADHELPIYWARSYSGGWFLPFKDATAGKETFGVGRYLLDQAKSSHLGTEEDRLVLDFNFAYHPSCVWGDWLCPLARPESLLPIRVEAGERAMP